MSLATSSRPTPPADVEPIDAELVLDIAAGLARARSLWEGRVRHDRPERHAVRLLAHDTYEVWLIGWPANHRTTPHDHGESIGALAVVDGELVEHAGVRGGAGRRLGSGESVFLPPDLVHDVGTLDAPATSIHVYSPPLSTMTFYEARSGLPDHVLDVADEAPLLDAGDLARVLHPAHDGTRA